MNRSALKYIALALVTIGLLYLAFQGQDIGKSLEAVSQAHFLPLLGGILLMFVSHALRAWRWQIVLRPLKRSTSFWRAYKATIAGYGMNNLIPRSGEIVRPYLMARGESIPVAGALASVVVERLADVVALAVLMISTLLIYQTRVTSVFPMFSGSAIGVIAVMLACLIGFILMFFSERRTLQFIRIFVKPLPTVLAGKIESVALDFSRGLRGLDRSAILPLIFGTIGIWLIYGISMFVSLQGFDDPTMAKLNLSDAFLLLTLSGIAFTIPTPGGTGSYHLFIKTGLASIFGVPVTIAAAYAIATHALSYITITFAGIVILIREGVSIGAAKNMTNPDSEPLHHSTPGQAEGRHLIPHPSSEAANG